MASIELTDAASSASSSSSSDGKKEVRIRQTQVMRRRDSEYNPREEVRQLVAAVNSAIKKQFHCRERTVFFYFWTSLMTAIEAFCDTDALESLKNQYAKVEPFIRFLKDAKELWGSESDAKQASQISRFEERLSMNELRLTTAFALLMDIAQFNKKYLRRDHPWNYQIFSCIKLKDAKSIQPGRQEDVLFWSRFLGEMRTRVPVKEFTTALFLHLQIVENQRLTISQDEFHRLTCACLGADPTNENAVITRDRTETRDCLSWAQFISLYGPTLDRLMSRMCGVTDSRTLTLSPWLKYNLSSEECMEMVRAGEEAGTTGGCDFIIRLARDKRNFVVHYAAEQTVEDDTIIVIQQSKIYLRKQGYVCVPEETDKEKKQQQQQQQQEQKLPSYPSLRDFLILFLCEQFDHLSNEGVELDHQKSEWSMRLAAGAYAKKQHQLSPETIDEVKRELLPSLGALLRTPDPAERYEQEFKEIIVDRDQVDDHLEAIFEFLENKSTGDARQSDAIVIGAFMILRVVFHELTAKVSRKQKGLAKLSKFWREDLLLRMIPRNITTMSPEGLKKVLLSASARLYVYLEEEKKDYVQSTKEFLDLVASSVALIEREVRTVNDDNNEISHYDTLLHTLKICVIFPMLAIRSMFWQRGLTVASMRKKLFDHKDGGYAEFMLKLVASFFLLPIITAIYFAPIVSVVLYHVHYEQLRVKAMNELTVTIFEVYTPVVAMVVFALVLGVTQGWSVYEAVCAEQRWLSANLMLKGSTTSTLELLPVGESKQPSKFNNLEWFFENNELPNVDLDLPIIRVAWSHFKGRRLGVVFVVLVAAAHAVLSILYRSRWRHNHTDPNDTFRAFPLGDTYYEKTIAIINVVCSFFGVLVLSFFLEAAAMHYLRIREWMVKAISLTEAKTAFRSKFKFYLPLYRADNFTYWALLRKAGKQQVDPSMTVIVGLNLLLEVTVVLVLFLRTLVWSDNEKTDLFVAMAVFDICALSVFLVQIFGVVVSLNETVHTQTLACLQQAKILLARVQNETNKRLTVVRDQEKFVRQRLNENDAEEKAELVLLGTSIHDKEEELLDIECCEMMLDSTMASMNSLDQPITVLGIVVDTDFVVKLFAIVGSGIVSIIVGLLQTTFTSAPVT